MSTTTATVNADHESWISLVSKLSFGEKLFVGFLVVFGALALYLAYAADVSQDKLSVLRGQYLEQRECVVADMAGGYATKYRCNKPNTGQYVSGKQVNNTIAAKYEYMKDNNCSRADSDRGVVTSYRCETSGNSATYVSDAEITAMAEKRYLTAN